MPRGKKNQFVGDRLQALLADMRAGMVSLDLVEKYHCTGRTLARVRREHGLVGRAYRHELTAEELEEFAADARGGMALQGLRCKYHVGVLRATSLRARLCPEIGSAWFCRPSRDRSRNANQDVILALLSAGNNNYELPYAVLRSRAMRCGRMTGHAFAVAFTTLLGRGKIAHDEEDNLVRPTPRVTVKSSARHHGIVQEQARSPFCRSACRVNLNGPGGRGRASAAI